MEFNLFALTSLPGRRILRVPLSREVQAEITNAFRHQETEFEANARELVAFDGKYKPDDGECLSIADFNDIDDLHGAIANPLSVPEINPNPTELSAIKALFCGYKDADDKSVALVQSFDRRKIISSAGISIFHSGNVYRKIDGVGITLDTSLTAILEGVNLKFFSFFVTRQIFDLSAYYNEATDADINTFAAISTIQAPSLPILIEMADSWVRRKVASVTQSQILQTVPASEIAKAASKFNIVVKTTIVNGQAVVVIPTNKTELKKLLRFLDEDYYQSTLLSENYITSSKRRV